MIPITGADIDAINNAELVFKRLTDEYGITKEQIMKLLLPAKPKQKKTDRVSGVDLKLKRIANGIKSKEVCDIVGKAPAWLTKVENGELSISKEMYDKLNGMYGGGDTTYDSLIKENRMLRDLLAFYINKEKGE